MKEYILGFIKYLFRSSISKASFIDTKSYFHPTVRINRLVKVRRSHIDRYTYVGAGTWIFNAKIGSFCSIAGDVNIGMASHSLQFLSTSPLFTELRNATGYSWTDQSHFASSQRTSIGHDVWIGCRVMIKCGVKIGNGAVIGAGAVVTKDVPPYAIVGGIPARIIRYRFDKAIVDKLESLEWWNLDDDLLKKHLDVFQHPFTLEELNNFN